MVSLILILISIFSVNGGATEDRISIGVKSRMLGGEKVPVIIVLKDQPLFANISRENHIPLLKTFSSEKQQGLASLLKEGKIMGRADKIKQFWIVNAIAVNASPELIDKVGIRGDIARIELDTGFHINENYSKQVSNGQITNATSEIKRVNATKAWEYGIDGNGINVSVIDTGINSTHPDIAGRLVKWVDFVGSGILPYDNNGHGTHVAGIIGGNGAGGITTGVAPNVSLFGVKVLDATGTGSGSDIISAIQWSVENKVNIISMSLGTDQTWTSPDCDVDNAAMAIAISNAVDAGVVVVAAAGNSPGGVSSPGCIRNVIAAGAVYSSDAIAGFSGRGSAMADHGVVAPGVSITSLDYLTAGYVAYSGTSMATPHVSGAIALILDAASRKGKIISPVQIKNILGNASVDLGIAGKDNTYGAGRIDAFESVKEYVLPGKGYVNGTVLDNVTKQAIAGAVVTTNTSVEAITNETGFYSLELGEGSYVLTASRIPEYYVNSSVLTKVIGDTTTVQDIELAKKSTGDISGTVTKSLDSSPVAGAFVRLNY